ncbi:MAG: hypothetical protein ACYTA3_13985, partial [Planctomycetota bacterium]
MQQQLSRTTKTFLEVDLRLAACVQRMGTAIRATECLAFTGEPKPPLRSVLRWIRDATAAAGPGPAAPIEVPPDTRQTAGTNGIADEPRAETEPSDAVRLAPKPGARVEPKEPAPAAEPDEKGVPVPLATYIDGVTPLDVRCPGHEKLELGIDPAGRLHVIA